MTRFFWNATFLVLALLTTGILRADTYTLRIVANTEDGSFVGVTTANTFVVDESDHAMLVGLCGSMSAGPQCFATYYGGGTTPVFSLTAPTLTYDNGSPCTPTITNFSVLHGACNNGHEIFGGEFNNGSLDVRGVFTGPDPILNFLEAGSFDTGFINASGDSVFIDGLNDTLVFAEDLSTLATPEPAPLALLCTGALLLWISVRGVNRRPQYHP